MMVGMRTTGRGQEGGSSDRRTDTGQSTQVDWILNAIRVDEKFRRIDSIDRVGLRSRHFHHANGVTRRVEIAQRGQQSWICGQRPRNSFDRLLAQSLSALGRCQKGVEGQIGTCGFDYPALAPQQAPGVGPCPRELTRPGGSLSWRETRSWLVGSFTDDRSPLLPSGR